MKEKMTDRMSKYAFRLGVLYSLIWFVELLDATMLNLALPSIARAFEVPALDAEWAILSFLLASTVTIFMSAWFGERFDSRRVFIVSQVIYVVSSFACGFAQNLEQLIFFRFIQGAGGGMILPLGMTMVMRVVEKRHRAKLSSSINLVSLMAPAFGPIFAAYILNLLSWPWLFFIKLPLTLLTLLLSILWLKSEPSQRSKSLDWRGAIYATFFLTTLLYVLSEVGTGRVEASTLILLFIFSSIMGVAFIWQQLRVKEPLISLAPFRNSFFAMGNIIQCASNIIILGSMFVTALYLQYGLRIDIVTMGWVMGSVSLGMVSAMPLVSRFYNKIGPLPYVVIGLMILATSMIAMCFLTADTHPVLIAAIIFAEGFGAAISTTANYIAMFSAISSKDTPAASSIYISVKHLSTCLGVALSTMSMSLGMKHFSIASFADVSAENFILPFYYTYVFLALIPFSTLFCCSFLNNKKALSYVVDSSS